MGNLTSQIFVTLALCCCLLQSRADLGETITVDLKLDPEPASSRRVQNRSITTRETFFIQTENYPNNYVTPVKSLNHIVVIFLCTSCSCVISIESDNNEIKSNDVLMIGIASLNVQGKYDIGETLRIEGIIGDKFQSSNYTFPSGAFGVRLIKNRYSTGDGRMQFKVECDGPTTTASTTTTPPTTGPPTTITSLSTRDHPQQTTGSNRTGSKTPSNSLVEQATAAEFPIGALIASIVGSVVALLLIMAMIFTIMHMQKKLSRLESQRHLPYEVADPDKPGLTEPILTGDFFDKTTLDKTASTTTTESVTAKRV